MLRTHGGLVAICGLMLLGQAAAAQTAAEPPAKVELISELSPAQKGRIAELWVGVVFRLDPGWHIYWRNPGDSGEPPKIQWTGPEEFRPGGIQWPTPKRLGHGSVVDYGYENDVKLLQVIAGPFGDTGKTARDVSLVAEVKYVVCREICIPETAHLPLLVPAGTKPPKPMEWQEWYQKMTAPMPKPQTKLGRVSAEASGDHFVLKVRGAEKIASATFFPENPNEVENSAPQTLVLIPEGIQLTLKKSELMTGRPKVLVGVLVLDGGRAYEVGAPIEWR